MSVTELQDWVGDVDAFMATCWRRKAVIFDTAPPTPISLGDLDSALAGSLLRTPYLEMVKFNEKIPEESYTESREVLFKKFSGFADGNAVAKLLGEGATLLLRNIEQWHRPTARVVQRLEEEMGRCIEAFFFVTPPGAQGLPLHRDDADVFLLQIAGSKAWTVRSGPTTDDWFAGPVTDNPGSVILDSTIISGQMLYIPRGFAHAATGAQGLSVHLSLTIREVGRVQLVKSLMKSVIEGNDTPSLPRDEEALLASCATLLEVARERLSNMQPRDLLEHARNIQRKHKVNDFDPESIAYLADYFGSLQD